MEKDNQITEPSRLKAFAVFFKNYMSISALITASLPIPVTSFKLLPTFSQQTQLFSIYTSLFCFLLLGYIFFIRHFLAKIFFTVPESIFGEKYYTKFVYILKQFSIRLKKLLVALTPLILIVLSIFCVFSYHNTLNSFLSIFPKESQNVILENIQISNYPNQANLLMFYYFGIFICAEIAFILMAIKEYLQDLYKLSEFDVIYNRPVLDEKFLNDSRKFSEG